MKIATYNCLAPSFTNPKFYPYATPEILDANFRAELICGEIKRANPDIICLQEIESELFQKLRSELSEHDGAWTKRIGQKYKDGSSIFWRKNLFEPIGSNAIELAGGSKISQKMTLTDKNSGKNIIIYSVHLEGHPDKDDIRFKEINTILNENVQCDAKIIAGDFNVRPNTPVYNHFEKFNMIDLCKDVYRKDYYTIQTHNIKKVCDFIFANGLKTIRVYEPTFDSENLPNQHQGSDHYLISAEAEYPLES
jgi:mRNA deadenylase 3'-5' endonuclease subunit Ccr4